MESERFDHLSKVISEASSRRHALGLLGAILGSLAGAGTVQPLEAKRKKKKKKRANAPCTPACAGRRCGSDGCGGSCGTCAVTQVCNTAGQCCTPACAGRQCGPDGCGGTCGACPRASDICTEAAQCCRPDCTDRTCGTNGCGGSCGTCPHASQICTAGGQCGCPGGQRMCPNGACVPEANCCTGADCLNQAGQPGECDAGTCYFRPLCAAAGSFCISGCCGWCDCSGFMCEATVGGGTCGIGGVGRPCHTVNDCESGLACIHYTCRADY